MTMKTLGRAVLAGLFACGAVGSLPAVAADDYPSQPVRLLVGFSAGGPTDIAARVLADGLQRELGQTFIVENRAGANATIATTAVARAEPDGYTGLIFATNHTINAVLYPDLRYESVDDFAPVGAMAVAPTVLVVNKDFAAKDFKEFLDEIKSKPGHYAYASAGSGGTPHLSAEMFQQITGTKLNHIPYKGAAPAIADVIGGHVPMSFATLGSVLPQIQAGQVRALAVAAPERSPLLPEVPTFGEYGLKNFRLDSWYALAMPSGTPAGIVNKLSVALNKVVATEEFAEKMASAGLQPVLNSDPASFEAQLREEIRVFDGLVKSAGLQVD